MKDYENIARTFTYLKHAITSPNKATSQKPGQTNYRKFYVLVIFTLQSEAEDAPCVLFRFVWTLIPV
jgi:hypothetical protein